MKKSILKMSFFSTADTGSPRTYAHIFEKEAMVTVL